MVIVQEERERKRVWLVRGAWNNALVSKGDFIQLYIDKSVADADVQEELDEERTARCLLVLQLRANTQSLVIQTNRSK